MAPRKPEVFRKCSFSFRLWRPGMQPPGPGQGSALSPLPPPALPLQILGKPDEPCSCAASPGAPGYVSGKDVGAGASAGRVAFLVQLREVVDRPRSSLGLDRLRVQKDQHRCHWAKGTPGRNDHPSSQPTQSHLKTWGPEPPVIRAGARASSCSRLAWSWCFSEIAWMASLELPS